ncbi:hypothetical protein [Streptomyces sp. NPDC012825]|uniref:hypothetical protein n=1 Tax=Streptomyces sp. NPDC012825 TaxID=3364851 RepID=UPI00367C6D26
MRAERWFDTFATTIPRDPDRSFPKEVWSRLTDHARCTLAREPLWLGADPESTANRQQSPAASDRLAKDALLGVVSAANFLIAAWRQQVLNLIGEAMRTRHHVWHVESTDQAWQTDGRTVFSDIPAVALAQARRLLTREGRSRAGRDC